MQPATKVRNGTLRLKGLDIRGRSRTTGSQRSQCSSVKVLWCQTIFCKAFHRMDISLHSTYHTLDKNQGFRPRFTATKKMSRRGLIHRTMVRDRPSCRAACILTRRAGLCSRRNAFCNRQHTWTFCNRQHNRGCWIYVGTHTPLFCRDRYEGGHLSKPQYGHQHRVGRAFETGHWLI